jgi:hypothetical protein
MAKKIISGLPAGSALNGTELVPIVQAGTTKRTTTQAIADLGNASSVSGSGTINNLAKFTASSTIGDSAFFDDGTNQGTETTTAVNRFIMSANASIAKIFSFRSANLPRWAFRVDGTESGSNAGADLAIRRYNDAGTFIDAPMSFDRSDGKVTILKDLTINSINVGTGAGNDATNTSVGNGALATNTNGVQNTAIGRNALISNVIGTENTAVGWGCLFNNLADYNTAIGRSAMGANNSGFRNTAVGRSAMASNTSGNYNTAIGMFSLTSNTTASNNTAIGYASLDNNTASNNTAVGFESATSNTSGAGLTALGYQSLKANTTGISNTAIGNSALILNTTGVDNTAIGLNALYNTTTGSYNTAVGRSALAPNNTGSNNTGIGYDVSSGGFDGSVILGHSATATASNQFVVGSASVNAGAIATEVLVSDRSWAVRINGTAYKILLKS